MPCPRTASGRRRSRSSAAPREAWIALAEERADDAVALMTSAADLEDTTEKSAISPGPIAPARELLGQMLLRLERPAEALEAFEATVEKEPGRFRGLYGAAMAAELSGDRALALTYYARLVETCERADGTGRPELTRARAFIGGA